MKQFVLLLDGLGIEYTGYFKNEKECIKYTKKRYGSSADLLLIRAVYPVVENEYFSVKTGKIVNRQTEVL